MNLGALLAAHADAWALLAAHPWRWLAVVVVFLVAVESLMLIPVVGFVLKLAVAGLVVPQIVAMFGAAALHGEAPGVPDLLGAFSWPGSTMAVLVAAAWVPFALGIAFLVAKGGRPAAAFFFGNVFTTPPPPAALFTQFKTVMQLAAVPFTLLAGAVVVQGLTGFAALQAGWAVAWANPLPVLLLAALGLALEWVLSALSAVLPKPVAAVLGIGLLVAGLLWTLALTYTVSARVFAGGAAG